MQASACFIRDLVACSAELPAVKGTGQSARPARIRPDQQVIQNREQILNEWSQVGPFLGIQGRASVCPSQNERAVTNPAGTCEEEEEILAEAQWNQAPINEVAKRVPGAEQLLEAGQVRTCVPVSSAQCTFRTQIIFAGDPNFHPNDSILTHSRTCHQ